MAARVDIDAIQRLIDGVAKSLNESDAAGAARWWEVPALALGDEGAAPVASIDDVTGFFAANIPWYHDQGIVSVSGELLRAEPITPRIVAVDIRWPGFDAAGQEVWTETSHYILSMSDEGEFRVRFAATKTE